MAKEWLRQTRQTAWEAYLKQIDVDGSYRLARKMEHYRTNEVLGYRTAGSQAERLTGEMLAREMEEMGLSQVTRDPFTLDGWDFNHARLSFVDRDGQKYVCQLGGYQTEFDTNGRHEYEIVYVGRGAAEDYQGLDVRGKLVLAEINQRDEWWINFPAYQAHLKGATALIAVQDSGYAQVDSAALNTQDFCGPKEAPAFCMSRADANRMIRALGITKGTGGKVWFSAKSTIMPKTTSFNVTGCIPGEDPEQIVLMSAHYDSYFHGFQDDNAAVALMLGIARALVKSGYKPRKTLMFCALAAEEWGVIDSRYDWSTGAYNQIFRVHPEWAGKVVADLNLELPAFSHDTRHKVRSVYEYKTFLEEFIRNVPERECYPGGVGVICPVQTWSDDFSFSIGGVPSMVNEFGDGSFMETHYHSQFDTTDAYDEDVYRFHHEFYGLLMMAFDSTSVAPLDFFPLLSALHSTINMKRLPSELAEKLQNACERAGQAARLAAEEVWRLESLCARYPRREDQRCRQLHDRAREMTAALLKAFRFAQDSFTRLTWHDSACFPHQIPQYNLDRLEGAWEALEKGWRTEALSLLAEVDNNCYVLDFDQEVCRYFTDAVLRQPADRLMWGAGRIVGWQDLSRVIRSLKDKKDRTPGAFAGEKKALEQARQDQQQLLERLAEQETQNLLKLAQMLDEARG